MERSGRDKTSFAGRDFDHVSVFAAINARAFNRIDVPPSIHATNICGRRAAVGL
jgi:hypothetical protein